LKFKAYSIQLETLDGNFDRNYSRFLTFLNLCKENSLVVAPELFLTGFNYKDLESSANFSKRVVDEILMLSKGLKLTVVYTVVEKINGKFFNCIHVVESGNLLLSRPKVKLFKPNQEHVFFSSGCNRDIKVVETRFGVVAPVICFELRFAEIFKKLLKEGAQVFTVSAQWGKARREHWKVLNLSRAIEFQRFLISSNGTGEMAGCSMIVDPWGRNISSMLDGEGIISGEIDLSRIEHVEKKLPMN
jgi:predicted amidohydrolase